MPYTTDWPLLSEVLPRLVEAGGLVDQVKADICGAIADRKVELRAVAEIGLDTHSWFGEEVEVPPHLRPDDIDWERSKPRLPWRVGIARGVVPSMTRYAEVTLSIPRTDLAFVLAPIVVADRNQRLKLASTAAADRHAAEALAVEQLARLLRLQPFLIKADAKAELDRLGFNLSTRGFNQRVWHDAHELAGLPRMGRPGAPKGTRRGSRTS